MSGLVIPLIFFFWLEKFSAIRKLDILVAGIIRNVGKYKDESKNHL